MKMLQPISISHDSSNDDLAAFNTDDSMLCSFNSAVDTLCKVCLQVWWWSWVGTTEHIKTGQRWKPVRSSGADCQLGWVCVSPVGSGQVIVFWLMLIRKIRQNFSFRTKFLFKNFACIYEHNTYSLCILLYVVFSMTVSSQFCKFCQSTSRSNRPISGWVGSWESWPVPSL